MKAMRRKIVAGNWKMNMTPSQAVELVNTLKPLVATEEADVVFCVPAIDIIPAMEAAKGSNICIGAENMYFEESGAFTGEISPSMLTDVGVKYVIIGHSERREYFAETDETVNKKVKKAFEHGITPIVCCGETLTQREQGVTIDFIRQQIKIAFLNVTAEQAATAVIAYEPIWAIGTATAAKYAEAVKSAKTVVWNGPMGVFENPILAKGTIAVAKALAETDAVTIIGGGDSAAAVNQLGYGDKMTHISTGGGASLEFLEGKELPGVAAANDK